MRLFLLLIVVIALCGCQTSQPRGAHLSSARAIAIAKQVGVDHSERLQDYKAPKAIFDAKTGQWHVSFWPPKAYTYGDPSTYRFFSVTIDDETGGVIKYEPGGWM